jgi:hypothetical protein
VPEDLQHLVLDGREAVDAALGVAAYLRRHASLPSRQLFSLRDPTGGGIFGFALQFALADATLPALQAAEAADAEARVQAHWAEVRRKQALASRLRSELSSLRGKLANQEAGANEARGSIPSCYGRNVDYPSYYAAKNTCVTAGWHGAHPTLRNPCLL